MSHRVRAGRLHRVHRGVYALGHAGLGNEGRWMAATLAHGKGAALSHRSAAELWALLPHRAGPIDVTVPGTGGRRKRRGIRLHRSPSLISAVTTLRKGIAVTTPARTLDDLARCATPDELSRAIRQAEVLGLPIGERVVATDLTRSELERRFLRLCRRYRLPMPDVNAPVGSLHSSTSSGETSALIVETDGYRFHRGRSAFEGDRSPGRRAEAAGLRGRAFYVPAGGEPAVGGRARTLRVLLE